MKIFNKSTNGTLSSTAGAPSSTNGNTECDIESYQSLKEEMNESIMIDITKDVEFAEVKRNIFTLADAGSGEIDFDIEEVTPDMRIGGSGLVYDKLPTYVQGLLDIFGDDSEAVIDSFEALADKWGTPIGRVPVIVRDLEHTDILEIKFLKDKVAVKKSVVEGNPLEYKSSLTIENDNDVVFTINMTGSHGLDVSFGNTIKGTTSPEAIEFFKKNLKIEFDVRDEEIIKSLFDLMFFKIDNKYIKSAKIDMFEKYEWVMLEHSDFGKEIIRETPPFDIKFMKRLTNKEINILKTIIASKEELGLRKKIESVVNKNRYLSQLAITPEDFDIMEKLIMMDNFMEKLTELTVIEMEFSDKEKKDLKILSIMILKLEELFNFDHQLDTDLLLFVLNGGLAKLLHDDME